LAATKDRVEETNQPACEAGGESASPRRRRSRAWGTEPTHRSQPTKWATDERKISSASATRMLHLNLSPASQAP